MSARYALALCESCEGLGETEAESHRMDCPDCLGTGYEEPAKRIMNLERELAEAREQRCQAINDYETAVLREHRMQEQRDTLAKACRKIDDILPSGTTNPILIEFRAALSAVEGGSHE
jgi:hypothetical protein